METHDKIKQLEAIYSDKNIFRIMQKDNNKIKIRASGIYNYTYSSQMPTGIEINVSADKSVEQIVRDIENRIIKTPQYPYIELWNKKTLPNLLSKSNTVKDQFIELGQSITKSRTSDNKIYGDNGIVIGFEDCSDPYLTMRMGYSLSYSGDAKFMAEAYSILNEALSKIKSLKESNNGDK